MRASPFANAVTKVRVTVAPLAEAFVAVAALAVPPEGTTVTEYPAPVPLFTKAIFSVPVVAAAVEGQAGARGREAGHGGIVDRVSGVWHQRRMSPR